MEGSTLADMFDFLSKELIRLQVTKRQVYLHGTQLTEYTWACIDVLSSLFLLENVFFIFYVCCREKFARKRHVHCLLHQCSTIF